MFVFFCICLPVVFGDSFFHFRGFFGCSFCLPIIMTEVSILTGSFSLSSFFFWTWTGKKWICMEWGDGDVGWGCGMGMDGGYVSVGVNVGGREGNGHNSVNLLSVRYEGRRKRHEVGRRHVEEARGGRRMRMFLSFLSFGNFDINLHLLYDLYINLPSHHLIINREPNLFFHSLQGQSCCPKRET